MLSILENVPALRDDKVSKESAAAALLAKMNSSGQICSVDFHDLRTPLTSISGNAGILLSSEQSREGKAQEAV